MSPRPAKSEDPAAPAPAPGKLTRPLALGALSLASFAATLGGSAIAIALPAVGRELDIGPAYLAWVMTAYSLAYGSLLLLGGRLGDLVGRRLVLAIGLGAFIVASVVGAMATSTWILLVARAVQGAGAAAFTACALALVADMYSHPSVRNRAIGIFAAAGATGFAVGAVMGGVLTDLLSWRAVLVTPALLAVLVLLAAFLVLDRDDRREEPLQIDAAGALAMIAGIGLLLFGLSSTGTIGWSSPVTLGALALGTATAVAFVTIERRVHEPLLPFDAFQPSGMAAVLGCLFLFSASAATTFLFAVYLQEVAGMPAWLAGLFYIPLPLAGAMLAPFAGALIDRLGGLRRANVIGVAVTIGAWAAMTWLMAGAGPVLLLVAGGVAVVVGRVIAIVAMTVRVTSSMGEERRGLGAGLVTTAMELGLATALAAISAAIGLARMDSGAEAGRGLVWGTLVILGLLAPALVLGVVAARKSTQPERVIGPSESTERLG